MPEDSLDDFDTLQPLVSPHLRAIDDIFGPAIFPSKGAAPLTQKDLWALRNAVQSELGALVQAFRNRELERFRPRGRSPLLSANRAWL